MPGGKPNIVAIRGRWVPRISGPHPRPAPAAA